MRALIVSYAFPPTGGAGVQRVSKLVKYLPAHGIEPTVLTVRNPSVPVEDESLCRDVPASVSIVRAPTLEPGYGVKRAAWSASGATAPRWRQRMVRRAANLARQALVPDPQILWQPAAQAALFGLLRRSRFDVMFVTAPPFSQFLLAPTARLAGCAVVVDYRDEWTTLRSSYEMGATKLAARVAATIEGPLLRTAVAVTTATEDFRRHLLDRFPALDPDRVQTVPNGYDPDDLPKDPPAPPKDRFVVTHAGTVFHLTSPRGFLGGVRRLHERSPELARLLEVRFLGRIVDTEQDAFRGLEELGVHRGGYVPHDDALRALCASHLTLCVLNDVPGAERIYPAKIFELMALRRPCLVLAPEGALARLARAHRAGDVLPPRDEVGIAATLARRLADFAAGRYSATSSPVDIERYDRARLAGEVAAILRRAADA